MQNQLFVGNLAFSTTKEELEQVFSAHGAVLEVKIPIDRDTGRVRGFAFVTFESQQDAEKALVLDGTDLNGRAIRVNVAQEKKTDGGARSGGGRPGGGAPRSGGAGGRSSGGGAGRSGGAGGRSGGGNSEGGWW